MHNTLQSLFERYGSDKAAHKYADFYASLPEPRSMIEVGMFKGASVRAWRAFWPNATIVGLDDGQRERAAFEPELKIVRCFGDSRTWRPDWPSGLFDYIFDDGSHKPRDQAATFRNLWPLLAPGGTYVVEDVVIHDVELPAWFRKGDNCEHFTPSALLELFSALREPTDFYEPYDYRAQSGKPDSVLLVVRKPV